MLHNRIGRWDVARSNLARVTVALAFVNGLCDNNFGAVFATEADSPAGSGEISLKSIYSSEHRLPEFVDKDTRALVLVFMHDTCPIVQKQVPAFRQLHADFRRQGIEFLAIYASRTDDVFSMASHAEHVDLPFRALLDPAQELLVAFDVERTSTVIVVDRDLNVCFRGPIDDQYAKGSAKPAPTAHYLRTALEQLQQDQAVEPADVPVPGCLLGRAKPEASRKEITFHQDVAPLLARHCAPCHQPGEVAPFSLLSYDDASAWAEMIAEVVEERRMPPWHAVSPYELMGDLRLSDDEVQTFVAWAKAGAPPGDRPSQLSGQAAGHLAPWKIGTPDWQHSLTRGAAIPATGIMEYQFFRIAAPFAQDRWISAIEVVPGNRKVVHHIQVHVTPRRTPGVLDSLGTLSTLSLYGVLGVDNVRTIGDFVPGDQRSARTFGPDQGLLLPGGHDLVLEMHYTPIGQAQVDRGSKVGMRFCETHPQHRLQSRAFGTKRGRFEIPPHESHWRMEQDYWFDGPTRIYSVRPHLHVRGKHYRLEVVYPAGRKFPALTPAVAMEERVQPLISVPTYDFNWQRTYEFVAPIELPAGAELRAIAHYDNSRFNPRNPDPTVTVRWGPQTPQEMFNTRIIFEALE